MLSGTVDFEAILAELARGNMVNDSNLRDVLRFIVERAARALDVRRVSVWRLNEAKTKLSTLILFDSEKDDFSDGEELLEIDYPGYFTAIKNLRTLAAIDAESDPRTVELREHYLRRNEITTMLDAPIFQQGAVIGVVCHEHCCSPRKWADAEKNFAASIADFISLAIETAQRLDAERQLSETANLLQTVAEQMTDGFSLLEPDSESGEFIFRYVNPSGARRYGYEPHEVIGKPSTFPLAPNSKPQLADQMRRALAGESIVFETDILHRNGARKSIEMSLSLVKHQNRQMAALIGRDITERKNQEHLRLAEQATRLQAQRLQSLGLLAGKIAHDFNNLLVSILGNANLAKRNLSETNEKTQRYLTNIETTAQIAADLSNQLMSYSGGQTPDFAHVDLPQLVEEMMNLLQISVPPEVSLEHETVANGLAIYAEPTQIRQILLNLILNAADATAANNGSIKVAVCSETLSEADLANADFEVQASDFAALTQDRTSVCLTIADNGAGMDDATRARIFEPFFTTKQTGHGLGLAALAGIVRQHHGAIKVESKPNEGTTFRLYFPAFAAFAADDSATV